MLWGIYSAICGEVNISVEKCVEIKGRLCWKIAKLFYFCHLKKLVRPETSGPCCVPSGWRIVCTQVVNDLLFWDDWFQFPIVFCDCPQSFQANERLETGNHLVLSSPYCSTVFEAQKPQQLICHYLKWEKLAKGRNVLREIIVGAYIFSKNLGCISKF